MADIVLVDTDSNKKLDGYLLQPRQELALQRTTQYCKDSKTIFYLHNVGSGKTMSSLKTALQYFFDSNKNKPIEQQKNIKIVTLTPTGLFKSFLSDMAKNIGGLVIGELVDYNLEGDDSKIKGTNDEGVETYKYLRKYSDIEISYFDTPGKVYNILYKTINVHKSVSSENDINAYTEFQDFLTDSVCICDEAHRFLRPASYDKNVTILDDILYTMDDKGSLFKNSYKTILMTGTPINKSLTDVKKFMSFVSGDSELADKTGIRYNYLISKQITYENARNAISTAVVFTSIATKVAIGSSGMWQLTQNFGYKGAMAGFMVMAVCTGIKYVLQRTVGTDVFGKNIKGGGDSTDIVQFNPENLTKKIMSYSLIDKNEMNKKIEDLISTIFINEELDNVTKTGVINIEDINIILQKNINIFSHLLSTDNKLDEEKILYLCNILFDDSENINAIYNVLSQANSFELAKLLIESTQISDFLNTQIVYNDSTSNQIIENDIGAKIEELNGGVGPEELKESEKKDGTVLLKTVEKMIGLKPISLADILVNTVFPTETVSRYIHYLLGIDKPFDTKKFANDCQAYVSLSDSRIQHKFIDNTFNQNFSLNKIKELVEAQQKLSLSNDSDIKINELILADKIYYGVKNIPILSNYPNKIENTILIPYSNTQIRLAKMLLSQEELYSELKIRIYNNKSTKEQTFEIMNKTVGNLSEDILRVKTNYNNQTNKFDYIIKGKKGKTERDLLITSKKGIYECPKFKQILKMLIFMKCGKMYDFSNKENNYINQSHFSTSLQSEPREIINKSLLPLVHSDQEATNNFLPIVYSISDLIGLGCFAGYLSSLNLKFILLHADGGNKTRSELITQGQKSVPMSLKSLTSTMNEHEIEIYIDKLIMFMKLGKNQSALSDDQKIFNEGADLQQATEFILQLEAENLCILLSSELTEGLDFKFNPAIFMLEPPKSYGDYDQLCGRVLRTYNYNYYQNQNKTFDEFNHENFIDENPEIINYSNVQNQEEYVSRMLPNKMVYQVLCFNPPDLATLKRVGGWITATDPIEKINYARTVKFGNEIIPCKVFLDGENTIKYTDDSGNEVTVTDESQDFMVAYNFDTYRHFITNPGYQFAGLDLSFWFELVRVGIVFEKFLKDLNESDNIYEIGDVIESIKCVDDSSELDMKKKIELKNDMCQPIEKTFDSTWIKENVGQIVNICGLGPTQIQEHFFQFMNEDQTLKDDINRITIEHRELPEALSQKEKDDFLKTNLKKAKNRAHYRFLKYIQGLNRDLTIRQQAVKAAAEEAARVEAARVAAAPVVTPKVSAITKKRKKKKGGNITKKKRSQITKNKTHKNKKTYRKNKKIKRKTYKRRPHKL